MQSHCFVREGSDWTLRDVHKVPNKQYFAHLIVELAVVVKRGICVKGLLLYKKKKCAKSVVCHFFTLFN